MSANDKQVGGTHYKDNAIQPWDYIASNKMGFLDGNVVKYITRYARKGGLEDLKKVQHYVEKLIELNSPHDYSPKILKDGGVQEALPLVWGEGDPRTVRGRGDDPRSLSPCATSPQGWNPVTGNEAGVTGFRDASGNHPDIILDAIPADVTGYHPDVLIIDPLSELTIMDEATDFTEEQYNAAMSFYEKSLLKDDE